jgi:hypothetical protein
LLILALLGTGAVVSVYAWQSEPGAAPPADRAATGLSTNDPGKAPANDGAANPAAADPVQDKKSGDDPTKGKGKKAQMSPKIRALLEKKLEIMRKFVEFAARAHKDGVGSFAELMHAQKQLAAVELELAESPKERVAIYEKLLEWSRQAEEEAKKLAKAGVQSTSELLQAQLQVLDAELALERAKEELAAAPK